MSGSFNSLLACSKVAWAGLIILREIRGSSLLLVVVVHLYVLSKGAQDKFGDHRCFSERSCIPGKRSVKVAAMLHPLLHPLLFLMLLLPWFVME